MGLCNHTFLKQSYKLVRMTGSCLVSTALLPSPIRYCGKSTVEVTDQRLGMMGKQEVRDRVRCTESQSADKEMRKMMSVYHDRGRRGEG